MGCSDNSMELDAEDSIVGLPVQDPPDEEFSSVDLTWTKLSNSSGGTDDVALILYERVDDFIFGECSNVQYPTRFHLERGRRRALGSLKKFKSDDYLEYKHYWCSFGPENYGEGGDILPSRKYRLNTRKRAARPQSMRGCTCNFIVKRLYARPSVALIMYKQRLHVNKHGFICHGPLDRDAIGPKAKAIPYVGSEIQRQTMSMIYLGIPEENVLQKHIEGIERYCGSNVKGAKLASQYVRKLEMVIRRSTHELDLDDESSIRMWVDRQKKSVFFFQNYSDTDSFVLGIQTEWQLQQMIRFGRQSLLAVDSTFGVSKLKYPLYSLLVFDARQHALPVAWVITRSFAKHEISKWMKALYDRILSVDPSWKVNGFIIDDAVLEIDPIRDIFHCPVLFSIWRIRRSWLKNIIKKCSNKEIQREIFKRLGQIICSIWTGADSVDAMEEFIQDFIDQSTFMKYFNECWRPKIEMWLAVMRSLPLASLEACGAVESYHLRLKLKLFDDSHLRATQRVDWLVHKLTTELHSSYWLDQYADESGMFENVKDEYVLSTSWHRALQIPDSAVIFDDEAQLYAKVVSQRDNSQMHIVWNPGSEFGFCDCAWAMLGNLCKHVIKVNSVYHKQKSHPSSMSHLSFHQTLVTLWQNPLDDSVDLDRAIAWAGQMEESVQRLVELSSSNDIGGVVDNLSLKWVVKKSRTSIGKRPDAFLALPTKMSDATPKRQLRNKKLTFLKLSALKD
ncbi:uncharacterized protein LOC116252939 [Nymphaea colorata]|nr:uncharacterized protein LOC116252939 [Nymphaea colorata]